MPEPLLDAAQIQNRLASKEGWKREGDAIVRTWKAPNFPAGIDAVRRIADHAEAANHHPDIDIRYTNVTFRLTTHDSGGLTEKDFALSDRIDDETQKESHA